MSRKILFFGNETLATGVSTNAPIFRALIDSEYQIEALIVSNHIRSVNDQTVVKIAKDHDIKILNISSLKDSVAEISRFNVSTAILAAFGKIVPQSILDLFETGIINLHPSLLPKHRGPTPIESVILNGDKETGVSIMKLVKNMDAGPIFAQGKIALGGNETKQELADKLGNLGRDLIIQNLDGIVRRHLQPKPQSDKGATYDGLITKDDGKIDWNLPADRIVNQIKAYANWPKSTTILSRIKITISQAHTIESSGTPGKLVIIDKQLVVPAGKDSVVLDKLIPDGKKEMSGESFLAGYKDRLDY